MSTKEVDVKGFSITIEPARIGKKDESVIKTVAFIRVINPKGNFDELMFAVPAKSRLDQEVTKLIELATKAQKDAAK